MSDTRISTMGPPPMSSPASSAAAKPPKNASELSPVPATMASVTPSVADTTTYRTRGVNAEAMTVSQRKPTASVSAVVSGTPRMARLTMASSQRMSVSTVEAAKTTAYWRRKEALVKSTAVVESTSSDSSLTTQAAASAQPRASDHSGSSGTSRVSRSPPPPPPDSSSPSQ